MLIESLCTVPQGMVSFRVTLFFVDWKFKCKLGRKKLFIWNYTNFKRSTLSQWVKPKYQHGALRSISKKRLIEVCLPQSSFNLNDGKYIWESNYDKQRAVIFANKVFECGVPQRLCIDFRFIHLIKEAPVQLAARSYIQYFSLKPIALSYRSTRKQFQQNVRTSVCIYSVTAFIWRVERKFARWNTVYLSTVPIQCLKQSKKKFKCNHPVIANSKSTKGRL